MIGIEAHFTGRLAKDAEARTTKARKVMTVLAVAVDAKDSDAATWCTVLAFEELAERLADLRKGAEIYAKGRLKVEVYTPQGGEPRPSLTLLAAHVEQATLERRPRAPRPRRRPAHDAGEPFDDDLA
ncbi:single-stranded DNA-binding protein [Immundisolibacter sp.]